VVRRAIPLLAALTALAAGAAPAQLPPPDAAWSTVETDHFAVHYPAELSEWSLATAGRLEAVHAAVTTLVGNEPGDRSDVLVHDPFGLSNCLAGPGPVVVLWPNPPDPGSTIGENRGWSEILAVHEIAHVAHLEWPTRNPRDQWLWRLLPIPFRPIAARTPRWAIEGYATWVEGRVTGSGRPHGVWRPAVLRQWAIEGRLPSYGALDGSERFLGGAMAYLAGSAFLEWLVDRSGEESLVHLWRRLTARQRRSFDEAFAGVFGGPPAELYDRFAAEVTARAIEVERRIDEAGRVEGEPFQRLAGATGEPAVSPDGRHVAVVVNPPRHPSRLVVWSTAPDSTTAAERAARERARDPLDIPAVEWRPRPREPVATLWPAGGRGHRAPRFLPDGRILVLRLEGVDGGRGRSDLFVWDWREGGVRRVTREAGLRAVDPLPGGEAAIGTRCAAGRCDVVRIDLATGSITTIVRGELDRGVGRPRVSPDGETVVVARQVEGRWRLEAMDPSGARRRFVDPDDGASRFDPAFLPDGGELVATSDAGGILDLERIDLGTGEVEPWTRTTGAAVAPEPAPEGDVFFLVLRSRGWQLHRLSGTRPRPTSGVEAEPALAPAVRVSPPPRDPLPAGPPPGPRPYGLGPRSLTLLPEGYAGEEGWSVGGVAIGSDPVGRLSYSLRGAWGSESAWRGASGSVVWRAWGPAVTAGGFVLRHRPSEQDDPPPVGERLDIDLAGAVSGVEFARDRLSTRISLRLGGSLARLDPEEGASTKRAHAFAVGRAFWRVTPARWRLVAAAAVEGAGGETDDTTWSRLRTDGRFEVGRGDRALRLRATWGIVDQGAPVFERFATGGIDPPAPDRALLSQRLAMPALPAATLVGRRAARLDAAFETVRGVTPFFRAARGGAGFGEWVRVVGLEASLDTRAVPYFGVPAVRARLGIGRILDGPNEDEQRIWASVRFLP